MASVKALILASQSPYRRQLLATTGLAFTTCDAQVDEEAITAPTPALLALRRAEAKALAEYLFPTSSRALSVLRQTTFRNWDHLHPQ